MWRAFFVQTMTGAIGAELDLAAEGSWSITLNGIELFDVTVPKTQLQAVGREWWRPFAASVLVSWERPDGTLVPWIAGPIVDDPAETRGKDGVATFSCKGIGAVLEKRVVAEQDFSAKTIQRSIMARKGMSLGTIVQDIVEVATERRLGGQLPIVARSPRETGARLNERTYEGWNLANNGAFKRIKEITEVRNGPDVMFRPEYVDDGIQWGLYHGTAAQPGIAQDWTMDLDSTSTLSPVADVAPSSDGEQLANRVWWTGAGEGAGTLVQKAEDKTALANHMPLLEVVGSTSDTENYALLTEHALARLAAGRTPLRQLSMVVDGSDSRAEIGHWHVGDLARVTTGDEWMTVPQGTRFERIIAAKGSWNTSMVTLEFQGDQAYEAEEENGETD